jgi:hypothetical protein
VAPGGGTFLEGRKPMQCASPRTAPKPTELDLIRTARSSHQAGAAALADRDRHRCCRHFGVAVLRRYGQANDCRIVPGAWLPELGLLPAGSILRAGAEAGAPFTASRDQLGALSHSLALAPQSLEKLTQIASGKAGHTRPRYPCEQTSALAQLPVF